MEDGRPVSDPEIPPPFGSWTRVYGFVLAVLVLLIACFVAFSRYFS